LSTRGNGNDEDLPVAAATGPGPEEETAAHPEASAEETGLAEGPTDPLEALRQERDAIKDALLRRRAEFENYRRRVERDRGSAATEAEAGILRQLLGTVDNLDRALAAGGADSGLREGVLLTLRELLALFDSLGVTALVPVGERFDPALHQAILHEPAPGFEAGTVAEVYRKGYTYKDRLLRPALVKVAAGSAGAGEGGGDAQ
jgi:molecular chaperone GrpE